MRIKIWVSDIYGTKHISEVPESYPETEGETSVTDPILTFVLSASRRLLLGTERIAILDIIKNLSISEKEYGGRGKELIDGLLNSKGLRGSY